MPLRSHLRVLKEKLAILDQKNLTGSAGGAREGQNMAHLGHFNGKCAQATSSNTDLQIFSVRGRGFPQN